MKKLKYMMRTTHVAVLALTISLTILPCAFGESRQGTQGKATGKSASQPSTDELVKMGILPPMPKVLEDRPGFLSWKRLMSRDKTLHDLSGTVIKAQGFMYPLDQAEKQAHFLLSVFPPSCPFCLPAGPEGLIEVFAEKPILFSYDTVHIEGKIEFPEKDPMGLMYRMREAKKVE